MDKIDEQFPGLGERLKKYRTAAGLSADKLAEKVREKFPNTGVSRQVIFNVEKGRREIKLSELFEISMIININPVALICDWSKPFETIKSGPFKDFLPEEVSMYLNSSWGSDTVSMSSEARKQPDFTDNFILIYGDLLMNLLASFETDYGRNNIKFCADAIEKAKACVTNLQSVNAEIPDEYMERFQRDLELMESLADSNEEVRKQWHMLQELNTEIYKYRQGSDNETTADYVNRMENYNRVAKLRNRFMIGTETSPIVQLV